MQTKHVKREDNSDTHNIQDTEEKQEGDKHDNL